MREIAKRRAATEWPVLLALLFFLLAIAVNLPTAFRIDEPNIIALAKHAARAPLDPYGFEINWLGSAGHAYDVLANPPLVAYWLAFWAGAFGWSEPSLHLAVAPFAFLALWGLLDIARSLEVSDPRLAPMLLVLSPAFVLGAGVVMPDVVALALSVTCAAIAFRLYSGGTVSATTFAVGMASGFACVLAKYNAIVIVIPLAMLWWRSRTLKIGLLAISAPAMLAAWSLAGAWMYGSPHVLLHAKSQGTGGVVTLPGVLAAFGLATFPLSVAIVLAVWHARPRLLVVAAFLLGGFSGWLLDYDASETSLLAIAYAAATGLFLAVARTRSLAPDWERLALLAWLAGAFLFQARQLFSAVRYTLPMLPPAVLLAVAVVSFARSRVERVLHVAFGIAVCAALLVADIREANLYRDFVARMAMEGKNGQRLRYAGHWGLQHYLAAIGAVQYDREVPARLSCGETFVASAEALPETRSLPVTAPCVAKTRTVRLRTGWPLKTISCAAAANFYGNAVANCDRYPLLLPFGFSLEDDVFVVEEAVRE